MSKQIMKVSLQILNNTYDVKCEPHERALLIEAAQQLDTLLTDIRENNPNSALERIMMLGGLQMTYDLLLERRTLAGEVAVVNQISERLISTLGQALEEQQS